jgi:hypothetical protein
MQAQLNGGILECQVGKDPWRVNQGSQFVPFFRLESGQPAKFIFWASSRPDLAAPWTVTRLFFGIEPLIQSGERSDADLYGNSLSIDEIAELRKCDADEVKMELQVIAAAWKAAQKQLPIEASDAATATVEKYTAPADQPPAIDLIIDQPLSPVQQEVLRFRGFSPKDFGGDKASKRSPEQDNMEMQVLYSRLSELKKVFDEPMAKEIGRQVMINEILLRRIDQELLKMEVKDAKFAALRETKQEIEATLLKQMAEIEKICPFIKGAINKMTAIGAFSDLARGYMEWHRDKTHQVIDGMFTNYEIQAEMRESQQLPAHYRPGWVAAMLEARAGLFDPGFRRSMANSKCKILDMAFQAAAKAYNDRWGIKLPDLLREGPDGEYPEIILADPASEEEEPLELRERENIDDQLAAEATPPIDLDKQPMEAAANGTSPRHNR